jgi:hypothetical protein
MDLASEKGGSPQARGAGLPQLLAIFHWFFVAILFLFYLTLTRHSTGT